MKPLDMSPTVIDFKVRRFDEITYKLHFLAFRDWSFFMRGAQDRTMADQTAAVSRGCKEQTSATSLLLNDIR